jgi:pyruvate/2-oxoglutarate dehydrogenase complex dihydrolipoamide acyltransferase (E2) component
MLYKLVVPCGEGQTEDEVRVLEWHKKTGDLAATGELLMELETGKALIEVRAPAPCALRRVLFEAGAWTRLGTPLAILSDTLEEAVAEATPDGLADIGAQLEIV